MLCCKWAGKGKKYTENHSNINSCQIIVLDRVISSQILLASSQVREKGKDRGIFKNKIYCVTNGIKTVIML